MKTRLLIQNLKPLGRPGFTLVEVLVVVAIIGVLVSLLIPSLAKSKVQVRITTCASQLRQIGVLLGTYASDCHDFLPPPTSPHQIRNGMAAGNNRFSNSNIVTLSTASSPSGPCPDGASQCYPAGWGWFYWMGYLPPVATGGKVGILECTDEPSFREYGLSFIGFEEKFYNEYSRYTAVLATRNSSSTVNPQGGSWDCVSDGMTGYHYRGWQMDYAQGFTPYPKVSKWKPDLAIAIDNERPDWYSNTYLDHHGSGLNVLFIDGHVKFGGKDIDHPTYGPVKPNIYYSMVLNNYSLAAADGSAGTPSYSGWSYAGGNGTIRLWNYYETGNQ